MQSAPKIVSELGWSLPKTRRKMTTTMNTSNAKLRAMLRMEEESCVGLTKQAERHVIGTLPQHFSSLVTTERPKIKLIMCMSGSLGNRFVRSFSGSSQNSRSSLGLPATVHQRTLRSMYTSKSVLTVSSLAPMPRHAAQDRQQQLGQAPTMRQPYSRRQVRVVQQVT